MYSNVNFSKQGLRSAFIHRFVVAEWVTVAARLSSSFVFVHVCNSVVETRVFSTRSSLSKSKTIFSCQPPWPPVWMWFVLISLHANHGFFFFFSYTVAPWWWAAVCVNIRCGQNSPEWFGFNKRSVKCHDRQLNSLSGRRVCGWELNATTLYSVYVA